VNGHRSSCSSRRMRFTPDHAVPQAARPDDAVCRLRSSAIIESDHLQVLEPRVQGDRRRHAPQCYGTPNYAEPNGPALQLRRSSAVCGDLPGVKKIVFDQSKFPQQYTRRRALHRQAQDPRDGADENVPISDPRVAQKEVDDRPTGASSSIHASEALLILQAAQSSTSRATSRRGRAPLLATRTTVLDAWPQVERQVLRERRADPGGSDPHATMNSTGDSAK